MIRNRLAIAVLTVGALHSGLVSALGLGELTLDSSLNQPFRAEIPLRDLGELGVEQIRVKLADAGAFENAGVDRSQFLSTLQFEVELLGGGSGRIIVTTADSVVEPYLDFIVEARWPNGKMIREYTVLLDLPDYANTTSSPQVTLSQSTSRRSIPAVNQAKPSVTSPSPSSFREPGGAIGAVDRVAPSPRDIEHQQSLPTSNKPSEYRIQHHDTMWRIASKLKPSSYVTTQQTMLALVNKNPKAFVNGNVNQIKSGYILRLPSDAEVRAIDHSAAVEEIRLQAKEWRGEKVARPTKSQTGGTAANTTSGAMAPQLDATATKTDTAPSNPDQAVKFSLGSAGSTDSDNEPGSLRDQVSAEQENLEKAKLENSAMQQRVVEMEKQIQTLQSLISLKNSQLAALQNGQSVSDSQLLSADEIAASDAEALASTSLVENPSSDPAPAAIDKEQLKEGAADLIKTATPEKKAVAQNTVADKTPLEALQSWIASNFLLLVGLVLALLALLVLFVRRRSENADADLAGFDEDLMSGDSLESPVMFASGGDSDLSEEEHLSGSIPEEGDAEAVFSAEDFDFDSLTDETTPDETSIQDDVVLGVDPVFDGLDDGVADEEPVVDDVLPQTGDVVAEAEIYVAYGRYDQAASLLKTAITQSPDDTELRLKLIDIYLDTRDQANFESAYQDLQSLGDESAIARVKESMSAIEGVSHWLGEGASLPAADNTVNLTPFNKDEVDVDTDVIELDFDEEDDVEALTLDDIDFELDDEPASEVEAEKNVINDSEETIALTDEDSDDASLASDTLAALDVDLADLDFDFEGDFGSTDEDLTSQTTDVGSEAGEPAAEQDDTKAGLELNSVANDELDIDFGGLGDSELTPNTEEATVDSFISDETASELPTFEDEDEDIELVELVDEGSELTLSDIDSVDGLDSVSDSDAELDVDLALSSDSDESVSLDNFNGEDALDLPDSSFAETELNDESTDVDTSDINTIDIDASGVDESKLDLDEFVFDEHSADEVDLSVSELGESEAFNTTPDEGLEATTSDLAPSAPLEIEEGEDDVELDLSDFDMDIAEPSTTSTAAPDVAADSDDLDLDLSEFDMASMDDEDAALADDVLDLDIELDDSLEELAEDFEDVPALEAEVPLDAVTSDVVSAPSIDKSALDVEAIDVDGDAISVEDLVFDEFDADEDDADGIELLVDSESVATKLDLARAYIDMGDGEGAREMLEEVLEEGDLQQKDDAQTLLNNI
ncbi:Uncharacterised protein [Zhongshania aliphaticivorans]|uniref:FimV N-terminal domain-containing protein n=1 Tax=Zhongshania aliphaticivorans TaxID=1470434 RepID=A0A5S9QQH2_9GAMM|nr:FimV/HubP family polar landmark protein [Zhongshania aliphaticivorans]CAA0087888.1 Uncharacterised protein [Zhongshania aliphaticivorans]CAA0115600.1 Uncharacterised protein [Zhongshania aliphaticivorans]CAA0120263.1 Uncharacterised protein [Zhongshania aliphaticivorans]